MAVIVATPGYTAVADPADYHRHATSIVAGDGYPESRLAPAGGPTAFRPPLYPLFLAGVYEVFGTTYTAGRVAQAFLGTCVVALIGLIAALIWGRRTALVAMGMAAIAPPLWVPGAALLSEPLFLVLELGAVAAVLTYRRHGGPAWVALAGSLAGLAILARTNGTVMLIPLALGVWTGRPRLSLRPLVQPAILLGAAALAIAPWTVRNAVTMDAFVPVSTQTGYTLAATYNDAARNDPISPSEPHYVNEYLPLLRRTDLDEVELGDELETRARRYMRAHPGYVVQTTVRNTARALHLDGVDAARNAAKAVDIPTRLADIGVWSFYALGLLAIAGAFVPASRRAPLFLWGVPALLLLSALIVSGKTRYRSVADPFIVMLASLAVLYVWQRISLRAARPGPPP